MGRRKKTDVFVENPRVPKGGVNTAEKTTRPAPPKPMKIYGIEVGMPEKTPTPADLAWLRGFEAKG